MKEMKFLLIGILTVLIIGCFDLSNQNYSSSMENLIQLELEDNFLTYAIHNLWQIDTFGKLGHREEIGYCLLNGESYGLEVNKITARQLIGQPIHTYIHNNFEVDFFPILMEPNQNGFTIFVLLGVLYDSNGVVPKHHNGGVFIIGENENEFSFFNRMENRNKVSSHKDVDSTIPPKRLLFY